jgi:hypothetical protein
MTSAASIGLILAVMGVSCSAAQEPQSTPLLLANQYGELCTMCVASLKCSSPDNTVKTTYDFQKKGFIGQMMTVLDYVPGLGPGVWETRDVRITDTKSDGTSATRSEGSRLSIKEAKIEAGGTTINRATGAWASASGADLGLCVAAQVGTAK